MPPITRRQSNPTSSPTTTATPTPTIKWYWAGDSKHGMQDVLIEYDQAMTAKLEAAFQSNAPSLNVDAQRYVDLKTMTQRRFDNPNKQRQVQRVTVTAGGGGGGGGGSPTKRTAATPSAPTPPKKSRGAAASPSPSPAAATATATTTTSTASSSSSASVLATISSSSSKASLSADDAKLQAMVDSAAHRSSHRVYQSGSNLWDAMLNQTDLSYNVKGHNKFYLLQLLEPFKSNGSDYLVFQRWGRVGASGTEAVQGPMTLDGAKQVFEQKFREKTNNNWGDRLTFKHIPGKYDLIMRTFENDDDEDEEKKKKQKAAAADNKPIVIPDSTLEVPIQKLIDMMFNVKAMEAAMVSMHYDTKKAPLGKLTKQQVKAGYEILKQIEEIINLGKSRAELIQANNEFYTKIPHDFGMSKPPVIDTIPMVQEKVSLLETLADIEIAMKAMKQASDIVKNPADEYYDTLHCDIAVLPSSAPEFSMIETYMKNTHGGTHRYKMKIVEAFRVKRHTEEQNFQHNLHNRRLLWHGSRVTNFVGILSQGLRIAPPEAPVTGYMFGKGVYFADASSKSANYCLCSKSGDEGLLLLCDVALGDSNELFQADHDAPKSLKGNHSVFAKGSHYPDPKGSTTIDNGKVLVPSGRMIEAPKGPRYALLYNEYIVYSLDQIMIRYLLKVRFDYSAY